MPNFEKALNAIQKLKEAGKLEIKNAPNLGAACKLGMKDYQQKNSKEDIFHIAIMGPGKDPVIPPLSDLDSVNCVILVNKNPNDFILKNPHTLGSTLIIQTNKNLNE